jgi:ketosteroid isomerase-like protein
MAVQSDGSAGTLAAPGADGRARREAQADRALPEAVAWGPPAVPKEEVVARLLEAFSRRDVPGMLALAHPEIVLRPMTAMVTRGGEPYRGHEGIRRYTQDVEERWEELTIDPAQIRAAGQAVVALGLVSGRGAGGSFRDAPATWVMKFRDGLVVHAEVFSDGRNVVRALLGEDA